MSTEDKMYWCGIILFMIFGLLIGFGMFGKSAQEWLFGALEYIIRPPLI